MMEGQIENIDLVYLWVDGNDPVWMKKKQETLNSHKTQFSVNLAGRYISNDEIKYSLRSVEKHLPWIRNIYIVTDNQVPSWLNVENPRVRIVDHKEILPEIALPCFNSSIIEMFIYRIPGLSEHFLYANDDNFVNADLSPSFFFAEDKFPIIRFQFQFAHKTEIRLKKLLKIPVNNYRLSIENANKLIKSRFGKHYPGISHHNVDSYKKEIFKEVVEEIFKEELSGVLTNHFRCPLNIQRIIFQLYALATKQGHLKYVGRRESCRIPVQRPDYMRFILKYKPSLFCLNDTEKATDSDRARIRPCLEELFPEKSSFEK